MKKSSLLMTGSAALVALVAVVGLAFVSYAQNNTSTTQNSGTANTMQHRGDKMGKWQNLTDEEKEQMDAQRQEREAEMQAKRDKVVAALDQGYDAWVSAVKENMGENAPILDEVNADNFARYAEAQKLISQGRQIMDELGIREGFGKHGRMGMGPCPNGESQ
jgi:Spy/CpxP family protein refolding chaperone